MCNFFQVIFFYHRGWRGPLEIRWSNPLLQQVPTADCTGKCPQVGFDYLWRRRPRSPSGQPVQLLCHPHSKKKFSLVCIELPEFQFLPIAPRPVAGYCWQEPGFWVQAIYLFIYLFCSTDGEVIKQCMENVTDIICPDVKKQTKKPDFF